MDELQINSTAMNISLQHGDFKPKKLGFTERNDEGKRIMIYGRDHKIWKEKNSNSHKNQQI